MDVLYYRGVERGKSSATRLVQKSTDLTLEGKEGWMEPRDSSEIRAYFAISAITTSTNCQRGLVSKLEKPLTNWDPALKTQRLSIERLDHIFA